MCKLHRGPLVSWVPIFKTRQCEVGWSPSPSQEKVGLLFHVLKLAYEVVVYEARVAELVRLLPVDVYSNGPVDIQKVLDELLEGDPTACLQGGQGRVCPVFGDDGFPKQ